MIEYSRDLLNSKCDIDCIRSVNESYIMNEIISRILQSAAYTAANKLDEFAGTKKMVYDITSERNTRQKLPNIRFDVELSWKFATDTIVNDLKKTFVDSNVYSENKEIYDIHDKVTIHRLIIVDWN